MPSKIRLTSKQKMENKISAYKAEFSGLDSEVQDTLRSIEENRYGTQNWQFPLKEAAETYDQWKKDGLV